MALVLKDSYTSGATDRSIGQPNLTVLSTPFTAGSSYTLAAVEFQLRRNGTISNTLTAYLFSDSSGQPDTLLATSNNTITFNNLSTSNNWEQWTFNGYSLTNGTTYHLVLGCSSGDWSTYAIMLMNSGGAAAGSVYYDTDTTTPFTLLNTYSRLNYRTYEDGEVDPTITSISDTTLEDGQTGVVISGANFSATGNTVHLNTATDGTGTDVEQTITVEGTTEITFTVDHGTIDIGTTCYIIVENSTAGTSDGEEVLLVSDPIDMTADISVTGCTYDTDTGLVTKTASFDSNYTGRLVQVVEGGAGSFPETLVEILWADANSIMIGIGLGNSADVDVNIFNLATGSLTNISGGMIGGVI